MKRALISVSDKKNVVEFAKGLVKAGTSDVVDISYPDNAAGKFVALYGFDELFDSLPDTIVRLLISNKSNENIALDVPESIGRFKFEVYDPTEYFVSKWTGGEVVKYYKDYAPSATTLKFKGIIEKPSKNKDDKDIKDIEDNTNKGNDKKDKIGKKTLNGVLVIFL